MSRAGTIALIGRPNVGKSTLMNALLGENLSIVSPKAQTTRHRIVGVLTRGQSQFLFMDTPGQADIQGKAMNRLLDRTASAAMADVDVVLWVIDACRWTEIDDIVQKRLLRQRPRVLGIILNKIDKLKDKGRLLPQMGRLQQAVAPEFILPLAACKRGSAQTLLDQLEDYLPEGPWPYADDTLTPHSGEFLVAESIRQQLFLRLNQELPYATTVTIDKMEVQAAGYEVHATIWVNRPSHKGIVIGRQGATLRAISQAAQKRLAKLFDQDVHLHLWIKVREGWADHEDSIQSFGYGATD